MLHLPGYLWAVDRCIDLSFVQSRFKDRWNSLKSSIIHVSVRRGTSEKEHEERVCQVWAAIHDNNGVISDEMRKEYGIDTRPWSEMCVRHDSDQETEHMEQQTAIVTAANRRAFSDTINNGPAAKGTIGEIFFEILGFLYYALEEQAVANSVWHAIRTDSIHVSSETMKRNAQDLPDDVGEMMSSTGNVALWDVLQLDFDKTGFVRQLWIIETIMEHGCLWAGH